MTICYINFKKLVSYDASFRPTERPFQVLATLKERHFWPVFEHFLGSRKSVSREFTQHDAPADDEPKKSRNERGHAILWQASS